ncbi:MAG: preprotein translocase subunit SecG [Clostridium sp.]|nr:preprotein translocase subunit SecG [Clostridium sp.]
MYTTLLVLIILTAILLIGVVLVQKSKGGGLASSFAGANQVMGVRHTNSFIEKMTWWLIGIMWLLCVLATFAMPHAASTDNIRVQDAPVQTIPTGDFNTNAPAQQAPVAPADGE